MSSTDAPAAGVDDLFQLTGRIAIVTGASSGLGERFARVLHRAGATVVLAARRLDRLTVLASEIGPGAVAVRCDVADDDDRVALVASTIDQFGGVDVLVNNAGAVTFGRAEDESLTEMRQMLEVNLVAVIRLSQLVSASMTERGGGSIVNVSSVFGLVAGAPIRCASYCASKGAVVNLTRELGAQWAARGIRVNGIAPGFVRTEMSSILWADERSFEFFRSGSPVRRGGEIDELDGVLLLLAGRGASYIVGQTIAVDGGWTAR